MVKVYIYGALDQNGDIVYVGKSVAPSTRLTDHYNTRGWEKLIILDTFIDKEHYWVDKLIKEGNNLENKEKLSSNESWIVGDVVCKKEYRVKNRVRHIPSGTIYDSGYKAAQAHKLNNFSLITILRNHPRSKLHNIFELVE